MEKLKCFVCLFRLEGADVPRTTSSGLVVEEHEKLFGDD